MNDMTPTGSPRSLHSRWVFPGSGPPLKDATVTIAEGRILAVGTKRSDGSVEDLGDVALIPGLVNAHTHLEFSDLARPIGNPRANLVRWLRTVIEHRAAQLPVNPASAISQGLAESLRFGVTTIGEIAQRRGINDAYHAAPCVGTLFLELIAPRIERVDATLEAARVHLERNVIPSDRWQIGLSPHAPYTVHPQLLIRSAALSAEYKVPLAMHLAESREELEFLRDGSGPFRELLESRGGFDPSARPRGSRPLDELRCLSQANRALVIHGNYLDDEEIAFLGQHRERMAVVYCPRTHAWFGHDPYPLEKLLAAGAVVALGTDSRASSPDLSVLAEMRHVARSFPALSRATILELGTLAGAHALGREASIGTLQVGKWADLGAVCLPNDSRADPHELLVDGEGDVVGTWVRGEKLN